MTNENPPDILYHYTTQDGLLGILKEKALWATKIQYMNDASELVVPLDIAYKVLFMLTGQLADKHQEVKDHPLYGKAVQPIVDRISNAISGSSMMNLCVVSFCSSKDLLSQWRAYCNIGSAYAIGFNSRELLKDASINGFSMMQCEYLPTEGYNTRIIDFIKQLLAKSLVDNKVLDGFMLEFIEMASTIKLECFREEGEWRLVSSNIHIYSDERFGFHPGKSTVIPYYSIPIRMESIAEVVVGPTPNPDLTENAVIGLECKYGLDEVENFKVTRSEIPYRNL
ncbi:DUF2971 domain-containing protein [Chloroflexota bacterium]